MTLDQLTALDAIVATGTFRGAAERLNKAQSAVSHQIQKLEDELSFEIFSRDEYRPSLTTKGEVFFRATVRVLEQVRALNTTAAELISVQEARVHIAVTATMSLEPILKLLGYLTQTYPSTHIHLSAEMMGGPLAQLMGDGADMIIAGMHGVPVDEVETILVGSTTILPVAQRGFPAAQLSGIRSRKEMQTYTQVIVSGSGGRDFDQSRDVLPGGQRWTVSDFEAKKSVIKACLGWGGIPQHLMQDELSNGEFIPLKIEGFPARHTEIFAIRRRDKVMGKVMSELWSKLKEQSQNA